MVLEQIHPDPDQRGMVGPAELQRSLEIGQRRRTVTRQLGRGQIEVEVGAPIGGRVLGQCSFEAPERQIDVSGLEGAAPHALQPVGHLDLPGRFGGQQVMGHGCVLRPVLVENLGGAGVELGPSARRNVVVDGPADERRREPERPSGLEELHLGRGVGGPLRRQCVDLGQIAGHGRVGLVAEDGTGLQEIGGGHGELAQPTEDELGDLGRRHPFDPVRHGRGRGHAHADQGGQQSLQEER
jgi:hypothetical protein